MAKGTKSKKIVSDKILEMFEGAFVNDKEIRIPMKEDGEDVQIKVTLTCAKECVGVPSATFTKADTVAEASAFPAPVASKVVPTEEEKQRVADLVAHLF